MKLANKVFFGVFVLFYTYQTQPMHYGYAYGSEPFPGTVYTGPSNPTIFGPNGIRNDVVAYKKAITEENYTEAMELLKSIYGKSNVNILRLRPLRTFLARHNLFPDAFINFPVVSDLNYQIYQKKVGLEQKFIKKKLNLNKN